MAEKVPLGGGPNERLFHLADEFRDLDRDCRAKNVRIGIWIFERTSMSNSDALSSELLSHLIHRGRLDAALVGGRNPTLKEKFLQGYGHSCWYRMEPASLAPDRSSGPLDPLSNLFAASVASGGPEVALQNRVAAWTRYVETGEVAAESLWTIPRDLTRQFLPRPPGDDDPTWHALLFRYVSQWADPSHLESIDLDRRPLLVDVVETAERWVPNLNWSRDDLAERMVIEGLIGNSPDDLYDADALERHRATVAALPKVRLLNVPDVIDLSMRFLDFVTAELHGRDVQRRADQLAGGGGAIGETDSKPTKTKRSTTKGGGRDKLIAALTTHHDYANGSVLNPEPIGNNELADLAGVSPSTASAFFRKQFGGYTEYESKCGDVSRLIPALKLLNQEYTVAFLFGDNPPDDF